MTQFQSDLREYASFRKMITPSIIAAVFWIGSIALLFTAVLVIQEGWAFLVALGGILVLRVICELLILSFQIHAELVAMRNAGDKPLPPIPEVQLPLEPAP